MTKADLTQIIVAHSGRFTLSDDSHGPHAVGLNYGRLFHYARGVGITELWFLSPDKTGETLRPVKFDGQWWSHGFWEGKLA